MNNSDTVLANARQQMVAVVEVESMPPATSRSVPYYIVLVRLC